MDFTQMQLSEATIKAIGDLGFEEPTIIQSQSIPLILEGNDIIGHSQTGTGKTAAFGLPAIERINPSDNRVRVLILCPTRELVIQASDELRKFAKYKTGIKVAPIFGGQPIERQIRLLRYGAQIVVGTPGRIMDHMRRGTLTLKSISMLVLDEADEMLNMGFREDIEFILNEIPDSRQMVLFSATMSKDIMEIANTYQKDPKIVKTVTKQLTVPLIDQYYYEVPHTKKVEVLSRVIDVYDNKLTLVFCNTKKMVDELVSELQSRGYMVLGLHGDMKQMTRNIVMESFKNQKIDVLVATDVAARGLDIDGIDAVINYDIPQDQENYVHRIGRTGRAGKSGKAFSFVTGRREIYELKDIERFTKTKITLLPIPSGKLIMETKAEKFIQEVLGVVKKGNLEKYIRIVDKMIDSEYTTVEICAALIKMNFKAEYKEDIEPMFPPRKPPFKQIHGHSHNKTPFRRDKKGYNRSSYKKSNN